MVTLSPTPHKTIPMIKCVALLSGGLDSMLAIRMMQQQEIEVHAVNFKTVFTCCQDDAGQAAHRLGVRLTVQTQEEDYLQLVRHPQFGYGKGANPCVDCRIYMFRKAHRYMQHIGAQFIVSGEVIGQRPKSQKKRDLEAIAIHADLEDLLLRPLSAQLLPPTLPEREGWVDRAKLGRFWGRSRKGLIRLAGELGIEHIPAPSTGCALTEPRFSRKVFDLLDNEPADELWQFDLLRIGRHFRLEDSFKAIVGRHEQDNERLRHWQANIPRGRSVLLSPEDFAGPRVLVVRGSKGPAIGHLQIERAGQLLRRYTRLQPASQYQVIVQGETVSRHFCAAPTEEVTDLPLLTTRRR